MTMMNRATYLQGRWKFSDSEDKANIKVLVWILSIATTAVFSNRVLGLGELHLLHQLQY